MEAGDPAWAPRLVRIPPELLHIRLDDLERRGVPGHAREGLVALLADVPLIPKAEDSAVLLGPESVALPCLAVLARHVGQALRDHNVVLMGDRARLRAERLKLAFIGGAELEALLPAHGGPLADVAALFVAGLWTPLPGASRALLIARSAAGRATFVSVDRLDAAPFGWRMVSLEEPA